jgi:hypothetical protein
MFTDHFHYHISELRDFCIPDGIHVANEIDAGSYGFTATQHMKTNSHSTNKRLCGAVKLTCIPQNVSK